MNKALTGIFLFLFLASVCFAAEMDHSAHSGHTMSHGTHKMNTSPTSSEILSTVPSSGKAREGGFQGSYFMRSTGIELAIDKKCVLASRGVIHLNRDEWQQCGNRPEGLPAMHVTQQAAKPMNHQHH